MTSRLDSQARRTLTLLACLIVGALALDMWQHAARLAGGQSWFDSGISAISYPLQKALLVSTSEIEDAWMAIGRGRLLGERNAELADRVASLELQLIALQEARAQSDREAALLSAYAESRRPKRLAHVIGLSSGGWLSYLLADKGSADGVSQRDVAVTREGVAGQVYAVTTHTARVLPLTDPSSGVAVRIQRTRETGILKGVGGWECELYYLDPDSGARPGDLILTAGTGGIFPKGLRVGTVTAVKADPYSPGKVAEVEPAVDFRNAEELLLLSLDPRD